MAQSNQSKINIAASQSQELVFQIGILRDIAAYYREEGYPDSEGVAVLEDVVTEKLYMSLEGAEYIANLSQQKQRKKSAKSKKLAVVKAAA